MFNVSGSEIVIILLLALIVLGPEKLPEAMRRFGRVYTELRNMSRGFQSEVRSAFEEPVRELRDTAELARRAVLDPADEAGTRADQVVPKPLEGTATGSDATAETAGAPDRSDSPGPRGDEAGST